jgi:predicted alpha/beta hydrolase
VVPESGTTSESAATAIDAVTADGVTLRLARVAARGARRGVVLCGHAMMTDSRYFAANKPDGFAAHLAGRGLDVVVLDFRGHGGSRPPTAGADDWSFDDLVELDLPAALAATARATGVRPAEVAILGHSLGGLVALAALGTGVIAPPPRLVLAATSVWLAGPTGDWRRRALMAAAARVAAVAGRMPVRAIRAGTTDEAATYTAQLTGWVRTGRWTSRRGVDYLAALARIEAPVWAFVGAGDWMCRPRDADVLVRRLRGAPPLARIGRATGYALDADHFTLFTRRELAPLWDRIADAVIDPGAAPAQ